MLFDIACVVRKSKNRVQPNYRNQVCSDGWNDIIISVTESMGKRCNDLRDEKGLEMQVQKIKAAIL